MTYAIFSLIPLADTIRNSFYEFYYSGLKAIGPNWVGFANYIELLAADLPKYAWNTFVMWILGFVPQIVIALVLASWFTDARLKIHGKQFFKVVIYLPNLIMASAFAMLFFALFSNAGPVNNILISLGVVGEAIRFMESTLGARTLVALMNFLMWFGKGIVNSLIVSGCCAAIVTYFSALTAYGIYAYDFKLKNAAFTFIMAILVMPTQVTALGFLRLITGMGMDDSLLPLILPSVASPAVFYFMHSYMQSSLPKELVEAARIDGSHEFGTFNRIVLPIMKPAIAVQAIFTFVGSWNNYFIPALVITSKNKQTLPIMIATLRGADYMNFDTGKIYMMITIAIVPIIIIYLLLSKFIVEGVTLGGVKE